MATQKVQVNPYADVEAEIKLLQERFKDIKKRSRGVVEGAISRRDARDLVKIRKQLGI